MVTLLFVGSSLTLGLPWTSGMVHIKALRLMLRLHTVMWELLHV
jgi:hypothetical protein